MSVQNLVIAGDYCGKRLTLLTDNSLAIYNKPTNQIPLAINVNTVEKYQIIEERYRRSAWSAFGRGLIGLFGGPIGMFCGIFSAKSIGVHTVAIQFKNGCKSLIEVNDEGKQALMRHLFPLSLQ